MKRSFSFYLCAIVIAAFLYSCSGNQMPKPKAYPRIDLPAKAYIDMGDRYPYRFQIPEYSKIRELPSERVEDTAWINLEMPVLNATLHFSYKKVFDNVEDYLEESRDWAYKHVVKADAIIENRYEDDARKVYGILYDIEGDVASPLQFYMTDSVSHFLRAALYINAPANADSLKPVVDFIRKDIKQIIESLNWN